MRSRSDGCYTVTPVTPKIISSHKSKKMRAQIFSALGISVFRCSGVTEA